MPALRDLRLDRGLTIKEVARDLEMSERQLGRLETGKATVRTVLLRAFADYYGVASDQIAEGRRS